MKTDYYHYGNSCLILAIANIMTAHYLYVNSFW